MASRRTVRARLAGDLRSRRLARIAQMTAFDALPEAMARMRGRATRGRLVVAMAG